MERGRLLFETDNMGTLEIEWDKVAGVTASAPFEVDDLGGLRYYGSLVPAPRDGALSLQRAEGIRTMDLLSVARISRLGTTFWNRLDGSIDLGTSYTSASELLKFDFASNNRYERPGYEVSLNVSATPLAAGRRRHRRASLALASSAGVRTGGSTSDRYSRK